MRFTRLSSMAVSVTEAIATVGERLARKARASRIPPPPSDDEG